MATSGSGFNPAQSQIPDQFRAPPAPSTLRGSPIEVKQGTGRGSVLHMDRPRAQSMSEAELKAQKQELRAAIRADATARHSFGGFEKQSPPGYRPAPETPPFEAKHLPPEDLPPPPVVKTETHGMKDSQSTNKSGSNPSATQAMVNGAAKAMSLGINLLFSLLDKSSSLGKMVFDPGKQLLKGLASMPAELKTALAAGRENELQKAGPETFLKYANDSERTGSGTLYEDFVGYLKNSTDFQAEIKDAKTPKEKQDVVTKHFKEFAPTANKQKMSQEKGQRPDQKRGLAGYTIDNMDEREAFKASDIKNPILSPRVHPETGEIINAPAPKSKAETEFGSNVEKLLKKAVISDTSSVTKQPPAATKDSIRTGENIVDQYLAGITDTDSSVEFTTEFVANELYFMGREIKEGIPAPNSAIIKQATASLNSGVDKGTVGTNMILQELGLSTHAESLIQNRLAVLNPDQKLELLTTYRELTKTTDPNLDSLLDALLVVEDRATPDPEKMRLFNEHRELKATLRNIDMIMQEPELAAVVKDKDDMTIAIAFNRAINPSGTSGKEKQENLKHLAHVLTYLRSSDVSPEERLALSDSLAYNEANNSKSSEAVKLTNQNQTIDLFNRIVDRAESDPNEETMTSLQQAGISRDVARATVAFLDRNNIENSALSRNDLLNMGRVMREPQLAELVKDRDDMTIAIAFQAIQLEQDEGAVAQDTNELATVLSYLNSPDVPPEVKPKLAEGLAALPKDSNGQVSDQGLELTAALFNNLLEQAEENP